MGLPRSLQTLFAWHESCTLIRTALSSARCPNIRMPKALKLSLLAISVLLIVFVFLGGLLPGGVRAGSDASAYQQMEVYSEVLQYIQNDYVVTPNIPDVTNGALHGLLEGLDPDSGYLTADGVQAIPGARERKQSANRHQYFKAVRLRDHCFRRSWQPCRSRRVDRWRRD